VTRNRTERGSRRTRQRDRRAQADSTERIRVPADTPSMPITRSMPLAILCLEDDALMSHALRRTLADHDVDIVERADAARARIREQRYAAWVLDIRVPDGSGLEVLAWARARGDMTPAVITTGMLERANANDAQALGAEFLFKPFTKANLDAFLHRAGVRSGKTLEASTLARFVAAHALPPSERQIVEALARGTPRSELASELGLAENSIKTLVRRLLARTELATLDEVLRALLRGPDR
jgi:DNA-binding NarL/FixJ family response regulator